MSEHGTNADIFYWQAAINVWNETGDKSAVIEGLRNQRPMPPFARDFIADLLVGNIKRKPRQKDISLTRRNQFIRGHYQRFLLDYQKLSQQGKLQYGQTPQDLAEMQLANMYGLKLSTIQGIVRRKRLRKPPKV